LVAAVALLGGTLVASNVLAGAQEPPVGNPPEPDDDLQHEIADILMGSLSAQSAGAIEEDPTLWDVFKQQQPDLTVTLGDGGVGGIAELPDVQGAQAQVTDSSGPNRLLIVPIAVGGLLVSGGLPGMRDDACTFS
jgi:hypothetical protein